MKKLLLLSISLIALFTSCSSDDGGGTPPPPSNVFEVEGAVCTLDLNAGAATIVMKEAKFAAAMPSMDIILPDIPVYVSGDEYLLLAGSVVPYAGFGGYVGPFEAYIINNFSGKVSADGSLSFQGDIIGHGKIAYTGVSAAEGYKGTTTVTSPNGEASADVPVVDVKEYPATACSVDASNAGELAITIENVSFAQGMPPMNIRIPSLALVGEGKYQVAYVVPSVSMQGSPYMPMERYSMSDVVCTLQGSELSLSLTFSMGYLRYTATAIADGFTGLMTFTNIIE